MVVWGWLRVSVSSSSRASAQGAWVCRQAPCSLRVAGFDENNTCTHHGPLTHFAKASLEAEASTTSPAKPGSSGRGGLGVADLLLRARPRLARLDTEGVSSHSSSATDTPVVG